MALIFLVGWKRGGCFFASNIFVYKKLLNFLFETNLSITVFISCILRKSVS